MMALRKALLALLTCAVLDVCVAASEETAESRACELSLSLEEFRAYAFNESPLIAELDREYAIQLARAVDTEVLTNPEVSLEQVYTRMDVGGANDSQTNLSVGQPIRLSQLGARGRLASLQRRVGDIEKKKRLLELQGQLLVQYNSVFYLQQARQIVAATAHRAGEVLAQVKRGVSQGLLSAGEEALCEGELARLEAHQISLAARMELLQADVAKLLGSTCTIRVAQKASSTSFPALAELLSRAQKNELSETVRLELMMRVAAEHQRVAALDRVPSITPKFIYQHTNDGGDFIGGGITLPLPFWNRNQGEVIRTDAERQLAEKKQIYVEKGGVVAQISRIHSAALRVQSQAEVYSSKVVPAFDTALQAQQRLYRQGKGTVLDIWQILRAYSEAQEQAFDLQIQAEAARIQLSLLIGEEI